MFGNLKKKLKGFLSKASKEVEVEEVEAPVEEEIIEEVKEELEEEVEELEEIKEELEEPEPEPEPEASEEVTEPEAPIVVEEIPEPEPEPPKPKKKPKKEKKKPKPAAVEDEILKEVGEELGEEVEEAPEPEPEPEPVEEPPAPEEEIVEELEPELESIIIEEAPEPEPEAPIVIEETPEPEPEPITEEPIQKKKGLFGRFRKPKEVTPDGAQVEKPKKEKKILPRLTRKKISEKNLDKLLWELELVLLENDIAKEVTEAITRETKEKLASQETSRKSAEEMIQSALKGSLKDILSKEKLDMNSLIDAKKDKPFVMVFFGFNGTGKTLTIGKFAKLLRENGYSVILAAGDTFRAAAIEQLQEHANNLNVPVIKQARGADSAAVIYDAVSHAKAKGVDVVLADTAGRSGTSANLMDELKKVVRVSEPDLKIFVGDSLTGNDAADQAKAFHNAVGIDGSVLTKVDCDPKGGSCISVSYMTDAPIMYLGMGQGYDDMQEFDPEWFLGKVF